MKTFISYAHEDSDLAEAWKEMLTKLMPREDVWFAEDPATTGGIDVGKWRKQITEKLGECDVVLTLLTPHSIRREWVLWENGLAEGRGDDCVIVPIFYELDFDRAPGAFGGEQKFKGDDHNSIVRVLNELLKIKIPTAQALAYRDIDRKESLAKYFEKVERLKVAWREANLFDLAFHVSKTANDLKGYWYALWTGIDDAGEFLFDRDKLEADVTGNRIRFVGLGRRKLPYPVEGVVSKEGKLALSYWSGRNFLYCGAIVLSPDAGRSDILTGEWMGYTSKEETGSTRLVRGRVALARDKSRAHNYWPVEER